MKVFDNYHLPTTVSEALALLAQYDGRARVIAGGTDLLVDTQADYYEGHRPHLDALVDVTKLAGSNEIREQDGKITIGCGVTHTQIVASSLIQQRATALAEACFVVGGPQVRNVATLCGNVAHALPAADGTVALMALDAEAQVARWGAGVRGRETGQRNEKREARDEEAGSGRQEAGGRCARIRAGQEAGEETEEGRGAILEWLPLAELFRGPGKSAVDSTREMITAVRFRALEEGEASAFARVMRPQGVALPILGMAAKIKCTMHNGQWTMQEVAISAGPVAPVPFRARRTEEFLRGKSLTDTVVEAAAQVLLSEVQPRTSAHRATREYRLELLPTLLEQTLRTAVERATNPG